MDRDVGQAGVQPARDFDDVTARRGVVDRPAERQAVPRLQLAGQHIPGTVDADEIGVEDADDIGGCHGLLH